MKFITISASEFSPLDLSGLQLWLDAGDAATVFESEGDTSDPAEAGDLVGYWLDKSGVENHLSGTGNKPIWTANQLNGKPTILFAGAANEDLRKTNVAGLTDISGFTLYFVMNRTMTSNNRDAFEIAGTEGLAYRMRWVASNSAATWLTNIGGVAESTGGRSWGTVDQYYVRKATYDGATLAWHYEGTSITEAAAGNVLAVSDPTLKIGDTLNTAGFQGGFAYLIFLNRILTADEQTAIEAYLNLKWGV